jgi:hypothetical protein
VNQKLFEAILENEERGNVEKLKEVVRRVTAGELSSLLADAGEADLYDAIYGDNDGNPFTNEAVEGPAPAGREPQLQAF